ncbi:hypothetical protein IPV08_08305 [Methylobacterium sp. SD274]|nr:hypothetical protein [Methylobacterium sp. SD274]
MYDHGWDRYSLLARGLIIDPAAGVVVATPFPKFFNIGERHATVPDLPFEAFEKLDGSLIIAFHHSGKWRTATKGALNSSQAVWAQTRLDAMDTSRLVPGTTRTCSRRSTRRTSSSSGTRRRACRCWLPTSPTDARCHPTSWTWSVS